MIYPVCIGIFFVEYYSQGESSDKVDNSVKVFFMIDFYSLKGA